MRFSSTLSAALLLGATFAAASDTSDVLNLTSDDFDKIVNNEDLILVEFFAPWCGHCKALAPEYEQAATTLKDKKLKIAKVDCVDQVDLCSNHKVTGYPTLKVFRHGNPAEYLGPRKADGIVSYMIKQSLPAVSDVTFENHEEFKASDRVVVIIYLDSKDNTLASVFSDVANDHRDDYLFGLTTDAAAFKAAGVTPPAIILYKQFDEGVAYFPENGIEDTSATVLKKFIVDNSLPLLDEVNGDNYATYSQSSLPLAYLFLDPAAEGKESHIDAIKPIAQKYKGQVNFVWIDASKYGDHAKALNVQRDSWPAFAIQELKHGHKYPLDEVPSFSHVDAFVAKFVANDLDPSLKSESVPAKNDEPVTVVVGSEYEKILLDDAKDVFVEFYAPWCGHCKRLAPIWDELGEYFVGLKDQITIAKMDATQNDLPVDAPFKISGFPTLKFKPAGSTEFVDYEGDRSLDSLIAFVNKHAQNNLSPPPKTETEAEEPASSQVPEADDATYRDEL